MTDQKGNAGSPDIHIPSAWIPQVPATTGFRELGITPLAEQLGLKEWQLNGHWCRRCQGIWYGYTLEAECPCCGNRNG